MSAILQAVQLRCDWCGVVSEQIPLAPSGIIVETPKPDGWTSVGYGTVGIDPYRWVKLADTYNSMISNLCPACSLRPSGELIEHLGKMAAEVTHADGS